MEKTADIADMLKMDKYFLENCEHFKCFFELFIKSEDLSKDDIELAYKEFQNMRYLIDHNFKHKNQPIKGPLSFLAGNARVLIFNN